MVVSGRGIIVTLAVVVTLLIAVLGSAYWLAAPEAGQESTSSAGSASGSQDAAAAGGADSQQEKTKQAAPPAPAKDPDVDEGPTPAEEEPGQDLPVAPPVAPDPDPGIHLLPSVDAGLVPFRVDYRIEVLNMDAGSLSWHLDVDQDGDYEAEGDGKPGAAAVYSHWITSVGDHTARVRVTDDGRALTGHATVAALDACAAMPVNLGSEDLDDADDTEEEPGSAAEIVCAGASNDGNTFRFEMRVADKDDLGNGSPEDPLEYIVYFNAGWGDESKNKVEAFWDGEELTGTWSRKALGGTYLEDNSASNALSVHWQADTLIMEFAVHMMDAGGATPSAGDRINAIKMQTWIDYPTGELDPKFDHMPDSPPQYTALKFDDDLDVSTL